MGRFYFCYSRPLMEYLCDKGLEYVLFARHPATLKRYWVFEHSKKLSKLLREWSNRKANFAFLMDKNGRKEDKCDE